MEKVDLSTANIAAENAAKLAELFPDVLTEVMDEDGNVRYGIDAEALRAHVGDVAEDKRERYQFTWPGKQRARAEAIRPIDKTMRPCVEESVNWDTTENLYIEGDNLDALKILRETYAGKIKMIYIDPPYNTGHDFVYKDSRKQSKEDMEALSSIHDDEGNLMDQKYVLNSESNGRFHSDWCSMMYPRLVLARDLLAEDGFLFISIGEEELNNVSTLVRSVFGEKSLRNTLAVRRYDKNLNQQFADQGLKTLNVGLEYILVIAKSFDAKLLPVYRRLDDSRASEGYWKGFWNAADRPTMRYEVLGFTPADGQWKWKESVAREALANYQEFTECYAGKMTLEDYWKRTGKTKRFLRRREGLTGKNAGVEHWVAPADGALRSSNWSDLLVSKAIKDLPFDSPKNPDVIAELMKMACGASSIVLDFFSGSASTAHAVMQLNAEDGGNRKFIMVQLPEVCDEKSEAAKAGYKNICEIGKERIRRAGAKIAAEVEQANAQLKLGEEPKKVPDIGFRVLKIDSSNFKDVKSTPDAIQQDQLFGMADNLKPDRTPEDILFQLFPQFEIPFTARIEKLSIGGKTVYSVDDDTLLACFDAEVSEDVIRAMATRQPLRAVLRDASFIGDDALTNFEEIFKTLSPSTETRVV